MTDQYAPPDGDDDQPRIAIIAGLKALREKGDHENADALLRVLNESRVDQETGKAKLMTEYMGEYIYG